MTDEIQRSLGRIEGKLDTFIVSISEKQQKHTEDIADLRDFKNRSLGIVAFISGVVGAFGTQLAAWIKGA
jgi:hypothetical protein